MRASQAGAAPPLIVIGMHRSGTTMLARMLSRLGVFMGADLERNHESRFFIGCNSWLLRNSGGRWDNPGAMEWLRSCDTLMQMSEEYLAFRLRHAPSRQYTGFGSYAAGARPLPGLKRPWGWKDPRNTFTLPLWLRLFPGARIVHIYRNGVAVAGSLRARARDDIARGRCRHERRLKQGLYRWRGKQAGFGFSARALDLRGAFSLWEEYLHAAFAVSEGGTAAVFTVKYEDFLAAPVRELGRLASFCGLQVVPQTVVTVAAEADRGRGESYLADPDLVAFRETVGGNHWMKRLGYV